MATDPHYNDKMTQRIWIGGLDPPKLTTEMVQKRIQATFQDKLDFSFVDDIKNKKYINPWGEDTRNYFFLTAKSKDSMSTSNDEQQHSLSPHELIAKQYHNVKWKGCQLQVQLAKLHFLQRLELERKETMEMVKADNTCKEKQVSIEDSILSSKDEECINNDSKVSCCSKRHLRIKKQHGEEVFVVDTKPIVTNTWRELLVSIQKHRIKYNKHAEKLAESRADRRAKRRALTEKEAKKLSNEKLSLQSKVFLNRAIHLKFKDHEIKPDPSKLVAVDIQSKNITNIGGNVDSNPYESDTTQESTFSNGSGEDESKNNSHGSSIHNRDDENKSSDSECDDKDGGEKYEWSDSDDDSVDSTKSSNMMNPSSRYLTVSKHNALDEFESAIPSNSQEMDSNYNTSTLADITGNENFDSLEDDVMSNLNLLSRLYPDIAIRSRKDNVHNEEDDASMTTPGLNQGGLMKRYDPTSSSASLFEVKSVNQTTTIETQDQDNSQQNDESVFDSDEDAENGNDTESVEDSISDEHSDIDIKKINIANKTAHADPNDSSRNDTTNEIKSKNKQNDNSNDKIYEQKKLEDIFQQKRVGGGKTEFQLSSLFQEDSKKSSKIKGEQSTGFSFGFEANTQQDVSEQDDDIVKKSTAHKRILVDHDVNMDTEDNGQEAGLNSRTGLNFPSSALNLLQNNFLNLNEGVDGILALMDDINKKEEDESKWEDERKSLTLDWKRKQKYAQNRKNKKMKFR